MEIIKLGFICIVGILLAVPLKSYKAEYGVYMGIAVCIVWICGAVFCRNFVGDGTAAGICGR